MRGACKVALVPFALSPHNQDEGNVASKSKFCVSARTSTTPSCAMHRARYGTNCCNQIFSYPNASRPIFIAKFWSSMTAAYQQAKRISMAIRSISTTKPNLNIYLKDFGQAQLAIYKNDLLHATRVKAEDWRDRTWAKRIIDLASG